MAPAHGFLARVRPIPLRSSSDVTPRSFDEGIFTLPKYMAIGHHAPMTEDDALDVASRQVPWVEQQIAEGLIDHVWAIATGGRVVVGDAPSVEDFSTMLASSPDASTRIWTQISEIHDALELLRRRLASPGGP